MNNDEFYIRSVGEIDKCDIPMRNVLRDLITGETHSFDKVSGGVKSLWLMYYYNEEYIFPTRYFGQNCYNLVVDISKDRDIYLYDDANMMDEDESGECIGVFTDFHTGEIVSFENDRAFEYVTKKGYY